MPATDGLQPILTAGERAVVKQSGGWRHMMQTYGLRPYEPADINTAHSMVQQMAKNDAADAKAASQGKK